MFSFNPLSKWTLLSFSENGLKFNIELSPFHYRYDVVKELREEIFPLNYLTTSYLK